MSAALKPTDWLNEPQFYVQEPKPQPFMKLALQEQPPTMATMNEVVMKKTDLIRHLIANKAKHDVIFATAIAGYWELAKEKIERRKLRFKVQLQEVQEDVEREFNRFLAKVEAKEELPQHLSIRTLSVDTSLGLVYPENHTEDYDRAISMMEASVFDTVCLSVDEYDAYVRNNWAWKKQFLATNACYVDTMRSRKAVVRGPQGPVGQKGPEGPGNFEGEYDAASVDAVDSVTTLGCAAF